MNIPSQTNIFENLRQQLMGLRSAAKRCLSVGLALLLATFATFTWNCDSALAVEEIILNYGTARETISIEDLETFVETGAEPPEFRTRLGISERDVEALRFILSEPIPVSREFLRKVLNSTIGQFVLTRLEPVFGMAVEENVSEVIDAFLDAADDDQLSLFELFVEYPETRLVVNGPLLEEAYNRISFIATDVLAIAQVVETYLYDLVCTDEGLFGSDMNNPPAPELFRSSTSTNFGWQR
jgi:hypothetical protein